jgi:hypothetical protein
LYLKTNDQPSRRGSFGGKVILAAPAPDEDLGLLQSQFQNLPLVDGGR